MKLRLNKNNVTAVEILQTARQGFDRRSKQIMHEQMLSFSRSSSFTGSAFRRSCGAFPLMFAIHQ